MEDFQPDQLRILVADDEESILFLYKQILSSEKDDSNSFSDIEKLSDNHYDGVASGTFSLSSDLVTCHQGDEAVDAVKKSLEDKQPFAIAFLDVRMPPGPDGIWSAEHIRALDPNIEIVIVTAHYDVQPWDITIRVPPASKLLYLQKPFQPQEIYQFANSLGVKWHMEGELRKIHQALERQVEERTAELVRVNEELKGDIAKRKLAEEALSASEKKLRSLSSQILSAQEKERQRVSKELHDELGQALAVLKLRLRSIEKKLCKDQTVLRRDCEETLGYIDNIVESIRRLSRDLSPSILEDLGLWSALQWVIDNFIKHDNIKSSVNIEKIEHVFSQEDQIIIFRIFQEALTNISKHAQATHLSTVIKEYGDKFYFIVEDDGIGFDVRQVFASDSSKKGLGLKIMEERTRILGGSLDIWSRKNMGTKITLTVPLHAEGNR